MAFNELILSNLESHSKEQLEERLNFLVNEEKLENKPHNGENSYDMETNRASLFSSIVMPIQRGPPTTPTLTETTETTLSSDETPPPPESITTPVLNNLKDLQMRMLY